MRTSSAVLIGFSTVAVVALTALGWPASRYLHGDWIQYWLGGRALLEGADPYDAATWRALHDLVGSRGDDMVAGLGLFYPLTTAAAALPFALLPISLAAPLWFVSQAGTAFAALLALGRRIFVTRTRRDLVLLFALALVTQPAYLVAGDGNITRFLTGIVGGSLALLVAGHAFPAGIVLGLGVVKPQLLIVFAPALLLFVARADRLRLVAGGVLTGGALLLVSLALRPGWIAEWAAQARLVQGAFGRTNLWGLVPFDYRWAAWIVALALVVALAAWWHLRRPPLLVAASVALCLSLFLAPYAAPMDQAVLLVAVAVFLATIAELAAPSRAMLVVALVVTSSALGWSSWTGLARPGVEVEIPAPALGLLLVIADAVARPAGRAVSRRLAIEPSSR